MTNEETIKPTLRTPVNQQSKNFEKNFKSTMNKNQVKLNEVDGLLTEKEFSLKKKIFTLPKMEALVFSDPKLLMKYNEMSEEGEEKYGYHYNETIMNMLFNDYVLNSPKYLQKYKMAVPKEKKRRDKSGINQAKKAGAEQMKKLQKPEVNPTVAPPKNLKESDSMPTKVMFLVNEKDPENKDVFAYFPEEIHHGVFRTAYSHIGQHSSAHPDYAKESRPATPEEYANLKAELEGIGYNLNVVNQANETTGAGSAGAFVPALGTEKRVEETTSTGSVGGSGMGSGGYAGPSAWGSGDLMKTKGKSNAMKKPIWKGGTFIQESNYLTDPSGFEKFAEMLNEEFGHISGVDAETSKTKPFVGSKAPAMSQANGNIIDNIVDKTTAFTSDAVKSWNNNDLNVELDMILSGQPDKPNFTTMEESELNEKSKSKEQQRLFGMAHAAQKGDIPMSKLGGAAKKIAQTVSPDDVEDFARTKHDGLPEKVNEENGNDLLDFDIPEWALSALINGDESGLEDEDIAKLNTFVNNVANKYGNANFMLGDIDGDDNLGFRHSNDIDNLGSNVYRLYLKPSKGGEMNENPMLAAAATGFGAAIGNRVADKVGMEEGIFSKSLEGMSPMGFVMNYLKKKLPTLTPQEEADIVDNNVDILGTKYRDASPKTLMAYAESIYKDRLNKDNIKEDTQTMIQNNGTSMSNKAVPTGDQSGNVDMGARSTGGMNENDQRLLEELNNELEAFSIHHNKLKLMAEDRKPSALVLRDRVGSENEKNFKSDLQDSGTKEIIDVEKELQWKDQQTEVGKDPQKLGNDIEKQEIKTADMKGDEALKNVGDSTNDKGDEIPKRNMTSDEQHEVDMMRLGQHSLVYDNEPSKRFEDRMKADMGDKVSKMRQDQMEFRGKAPMYNKDTQPVEDGIEKDQFNKEKAGWNKNIGVNESIVTGKYYDELGKRRLIDFKLNETLEIVKEEDAENYFELNFAGLGNTYSNKVTVNEGVVNALSTYKFYTDGSSVYRFSATHVINEAASKTKPVMNEQMDKMKHLLGYEPKSFVNTNNVKKNRGF